MTSFERRGEFKREDVILLLERHNIPFASWGQGHAKTLEHLLKELESGESVLEEDESGELLLKANIVDVEIFHTDRTGKRLKLVEEKQVFNDGRERKRDMPGVAEKMKPGEKPEEAARRGILEELGINLRDVRYHSKNEDTLESFSYPGLKRSSVFYRFSAELDSGEFKPEGYTEVQPDKVATFVWVEA
jgi:hypothetical protein